MILFAGLIWPPAFVLFGGGQNLLLAHLVNEHNYKSIGYVPVARDSSCSKEKLDSFLSVIGEFSLPGSRNGVVSLSQLQENRLPLSHDALILESREIAVRVKEVLEARGYKVPGDVALACFSGILSLDPSFPVRGSTIAWLILFLA